MGDQSSGAATPEQEHFYKLILDGLARLDRRTEEMSERLIRVEESNFTELAKENRSRIRDLENKVDNLESDRDRRDGALATAGWASRYVPWIMTTIFGLGAIIAWLRPPV